VEELAFLREALGPGRGQVCVDLACGTGLGAQPIAEAGYRAVGFDISADQLRFARRRLDAVARADACSLPVRDESVPVVVGMFFHTDLEDFAAALNPQPSGQLGGPSGDRGHVHLAAPRPGRAMQGPAMSRPAGSEQDRVSVPRSARGSDTR
jgi:SAM-dependent methyltransferase